MSRRSRRTAILSVIALVVVVAFGTLGFYLVAGTDAVDSFYFECMLATGQGPPFPLTTDAAKLYASAMAFLSVGTVVTTLFLNLGPIVVRWSREGLEYVEREARKVESEVREEVHRGSPPP